MEYVSADGVVTTIKCDTSVLQQVYDNIRNELYKIIQKPFPRFDLEWVSYNIDGVMVTANSVDLLKSAFNEENLGYSITQCRKIDEKHYEYKGETRLFC
jgi:hypothetical protein